MVAEATVDLGGVVKGRVGTVLQATGLCVLSLSVGLIYAPAGGIVAAAGLVLFGIAAEKD